MNNNLDVAIVGAGTAGLSCAIELKRLGIKNITVFERSFEAGGAPLHCGHKGFGIFEFKKILTGPEYAKVLARKANNNGVKIALNHTLYRFKGNSLDFITPDGIKTFKAKKVLLALGVRETPRAQRLISGKRDPNIITTGTLQRFIYQKNRIPFKSSVIYGSEVVSFSALKSEQSFGIKANAMIEKDDKIEFYPVIKPVVEKLFNIKIFTGINNSEIFHDNDKLKIKNIGDKELECEGIVFSGSFKPESAIMKNSSLDFNFTNYSPKVSQNFQTSDENFFMAGNIIRGAYASYKCFYEGKEAAKAIFLSLKNQTKPIFVKVDCKSDDIKWYYPSLIDLKSFKKTLCNLSFKGYKKGTVKVYLNDQLVYKKQIETKPYKTYEIPWINANLDTKDIISIDFEIDTFYAGISSK